MAEAIQTSDVADYALDVLGDWIGGYTTSEEGPQLRYRCVAFDAEARSLVVRAETCDPFPSDPQEFRITINVERLADE